MADVNDEDRKRIRCVPCNLVQFVNRSRTCVKCKQPFTRLKEQPVIEVKPPVVIEVQPMKNQSYWLPFALVYLRKKQRLSIQHLAAKVKLKHQNVSRMENGHVLPTLATISRFCEALSVEPAYLIRMTEFLVWGK